MASPLLATSIAVLAAFSALVGDRAEAGVNRVWNLSGPGPLVTGNWATAADWSPTGVPQAGDAIFVTSVDPQVKVVTFDGSSLGLPNQFPSILIDESGTGAINLDQQALFLGADRLTIGLGGHGIYTVEAGSCQFGSLTMNNQSSLDLFGAALMQVTSTFTQNGGTLLTSGTLNAGSYTLQNGTLTFIFGSMSGGNFTQNGGTIHSQIDGTMSFSGTYALNGGTFVIDPNSFPAVNAGTFIDNVGTFAAATLDANKLIVNGNGTFLGDVSNHSDLNVPSAQTIFIHRTFNQIGGSVTQNGIVGGLAPGGFFTDMSTVTVGGGANWAQSGGVLQGNTLIIGAGQTGPGTYTLSGTGSINVGTLIVGQQDAVLGQFSQTGGDAQIGQLICNVNSSTTGIVNMSGGSMTVADPSVNNGTFTQSGGAVFFDNLDGAGSVSITGTGSLSVKRLRQNSLFIGGSAQVATRSLSFGTIGANASTTSRVHMLSFEQVGNTINGSFDLGSNALVIDYDGGFSPAASVRRYLTSGYAAGAWTGTGINSRGAAALDIAHRAALGYGEASEIFGAGGGVFRGLAVDNSAILIGLAFYGDANLDGTVDTLDFNALAANFGKTAQRWSTGDFNYDGSVDTLDFNSLAANFGRALPEDGGAVEMVPEPLAIGFGAALLFVPRRRNRYVAGAAAATAGTVIRGFRKYDNA